MTDAAKARIDALKAADPTNTLPIPVDLVTSSASGVDPHITSAAAEYQVNRIARVRHMSTDALKRLIDQFTEGRAFSVLGESRVNVLKLNLALDSYNG